MAYKFDEEIYSYFKLEMYNAEDIAENGDNSSKFERGEYDQLPSPEIIAEQVKKRGFDTFEVTHVTEVVKRYTVNSP